MLERQVLLLQEIKQTKNPELGLTLALKKLGELGLAHAGQLQLAAFQDSTITIAHQKLLKLSKSKSIDNPIGFLIKSCNDLKNASGERPDYKWQSSLMEAYGYDKSTPTMVVRPAQADSPMEELGYAQDRPQKSIVSKARPSTQAFAWTDAGKVAIGHAPDTSHLDEPADWVLPDLGPTWQGILVLGTMDFVAQIRTLDMEPDTRALAAELFAKKAIAGIYQLGTEWGFLPNQAGLRRTRSRNPLTEAAAARQTTMLKGGKDQWLARLQTAESQLDETA